MYNFYMERAKFIDTLKLLVMPVVLIGVVIFVLLQSNAPISPITQQPAAGAPIYLPALPG